MITISSSLFVFLAPNFLLIVHELVAFYRNRFSFELANIEKHGQH